MFLHASNMFPQSCCCCTSVNIITNTRSKYDLNGYCFYVHKNTSVLISVHRASTLKHHSQWLGDYVSQPTRGPQGSSHIQHSRRPNYHWTNYPTTALQHGLSEGFIHLLLPFSSRHYIHLPLSRILQTSRHLLPFHIKPLYAIACFAHWLLYTCFNKCFVVCRFINVVMYKKIMGSSMKKIIIHPSRSWGS